MRLKCYRCNKTATRRVGIADPDMTQYPYCEYHAEVMRNFIVLTGFPALLRERGDKELMAIAEAMAKKGMSQ